MFQDATSQPFGYLVLDLHPPRTTNVQRLRTRILPTDHGSTGKTIKLRNHYQLSLVSSMTAFKAHQSRPERRQGNVAERRQCSLTFSHK